MCFCSIFPSLLYCNSVKSVKKLVGHKKCVKKQFGVTKAMCKNEVISIKSTEKLLFLNIHMNFEKSKKYVHKFMVWQSVREKGPAF